MKNILRIILATFARAMIHKHNPTIIGVTGSVGKTSARLAIYAVLKQKYRVRTAEKNYNNEIGLPLTILGIPHHGRNILKWAYAFVRVIWRLSASVSDRYPQVLVLEYGVDRRGDMDISLAIAKPNIAVVTAIGGIPAHVEFFKDAREIAAEKGKLIAALPVEGWAILNRDDCAAADMREKTPAHILTFGRESHAEVRIIFNDAPVKNSASQNAALPDQSKAENTVLPKGIAFKLEYNGSVVPVRLEGAFGLPPAYAAAAAAGAGLALGMNLIEISEALAGWRPPPGRMRLLEGKNHSRILDDTYNAAPDAMRSALETLRSLPGKRRIAVLGDMLELGRYAEQAHRAIGDLAADSADLLFCVGPRAKFIADAARRRGMSAERIFLFDDSLSAIEGLTPMIEEADLILVKGSQGMRMERVVKEIMAEPARAKYLLVRQEPYWLQKNPTPTQ